MILVDANYVSYHVRVYHLFKAFPKQTSTLENILKYLILSSSPNSITSLCLV